jgi:hypothetical protein
MANTTSFNWETPDDTDLVKDGAAAIRTLGNSIDTSMTDLLGGTTGQVLAKASATDMDFTWAPGGANSDYSLLNAGGTALTGAAEITISGISGMNNLMIIVDAASSASSNSLISVRINSDATAAFYEQYGVNNNIQGTYTPSLFSGMDNQTTSFFLARMPSTAAGTASGYLYLTGCNSDGLKVMQLSGGGVGTGVASNQETYSAGGIYKGTATVSSINIRSGTGNFDAGTVYIYGSAV